MPQTTLTRYPTCLTLVDSIDKQLLLGPTLFDQKLPEISVWHSERVVPTAVARCRGSLGIEGRQLVKRRLLVRDRQYRKERGSRDDQNGRGYAGQVT